MNKTKNTNEKVSADQNVRTQEEYDSRLRALSKSGKVFTPKASAPSEAVRKASEDYYIKTRGCSRENARSYLRTETDEDRYLRQQSDPRSNPNRFAKAAEAAIKPAAPSLPAVCGQPAKAALPPFKSVHELVDELERVKQLRIDETTHLSQQINDRESELEIVKAQLAQRDKDYMGCFEIREQYKAQRDGLLAALKRSLNWLTSYPGNGAAKVADQARAAIAAAEGRAS